MIERKNLASCEAALLQEGRKVLGEEELLAKAGLIFDIAVRLSSFTFFVVTASWKTLFVTRLFLADPSLFYAFLLDHFFP